MFEIAQINFDFYSCFLLSKRLQICLVLASILPALKIDDINATALISLSNKFGIFSRVIPPIATMGNLQKVLTCAISSAEALGAWGLVEVG